MPRGFLVKRQDSEERNDPLDLTRKSSSVQLSAARDQLRREGKILSAPVWRPAIADDCKIDAKPKPADVRSSCEDSSPTPDVVTSGTEVVSLEAALRWYHQRLPFLTAPGANLYPTLPFASSFHFYPHYASLLMPPVISQTASPVSPVPVPTPSPETYSDGLDLSVKSSHGQLSSPVNRESATSHTAPSTGSKKSTQSSVTCTPSSEAKKRPNDSKVEVLSNKKSRACGSSKRQKAARKLSFDDELISPVSGTIIKDASEMEDGMVVCPGDIDPAFNLVEVTEEARAELAKIENRIGDYVCRLCRVLYEDAFGLAQHRCPRIVHVEYRCPECDKVFNCPANLASHRRWHKPRQQGSNPKNSSASGAAQSKAENQSSSRSGLSLINNNNHKDKTSDTVLLARHLLNFAKGNLQNACNYPTNPVTGYSFTSSEHLRSVSPATSSQDSSQQTSPLRLIQAPQVRAAT